MLDLPNIRKMVNKVSVEIPRLGAPAKIKIY